MSSKVAPAAACTNVGGSGGKGISSDNNKAGTKSGTGTGTGNASLLPTTTTSTPVTPSSQPPPQPQPPLPPTNEPRPPRRSVSSRNRRPNSDDLPVPSQYYGGYQQQAPLPPPQYGYNFGASSLPAAHNPYMHGGAGANVMYGSHQPPMNLYPSNSTLPFPYPIVGDAGRQGDDSQENLNFAPNSTDLMLQQQQQLYQQQQQQQQQLYPNSTLPFPYPVVADAGRQGDDSQENLNFIPNTNDLMLQQQQQLYQQQQQQQQQLYQQQQQQLYQQQVMMAQKVDKNQQQRQHRRDRRKSLHRKSLSSSAVIDGRAGGGQYGAFWNAPMPPPPPPAGHANPPPPPPNNYREQFLMYHHAASTGAITSPTTGSSSGQQQYRKQLNPSGSPRDGNNNNQQQQQQQQQQQHHKQAMYGSQAKSFSPRNEFRKMLKDLSPSQQHHKSFHGGSIPTAAANVANIASSNVRASRASTGSAPPAVQYPSVTSIWTPYTPQPSMHPTIMPGIMQSITSQSGHHHHSVRQLPSPTSGGGVGVGVGVGGEPVNLLRAASTPSKESNRKKHIRQQSAQHYMEAVKGVEQPLVCRNVGVLLVFVFHLLFIGVYLGQQFAHEALIYHDPHKNPDTVTIYYDNLLYLSAASGSFAIITSTLLLCAMTLFARLFLQIALMIIITLSFIWGTIGIGLSPKTVVPVTGIIALGLAVAYAFIVWDRIPFSGANLLTALSGIRAYPGTVIVAICMQIIALGWCIYFSVVCSGIYNAIQEGKIELSKNAIVTSYILLVISFCWTYQVILGCVESITAGVISSWWHTPNSPGQVRDSCFKTLFYSIGSVCFGGLVVGPVAFLRQISVLVRPSQTEPSLLCLHECMYFIQVFISGVVDSMTARFNAYSFTYVGMYQYRLWDAGKMATELFDKRGWTTIVSDDLVPNVLFLTSLVLGGVTGCFAHLLSQSDQMSITSLEDPGASSFLLGAAIGLVLSSIIFSVVSSAVNTVLVCFASSPVDFERNHPDLNTEMRAAWREVWPGALDINDLHYHMSFQHDELMIDECTPLM